jgi:hypothetical protein
VRKDRLEQKQNRIFKKVEIFEIGKRGDVERDGCNHPSFLISRRPPNTFSQPVIADGQTEDQEKIDWAPSDVEDIACEKQNLHPPLWRT